MEPSSSFEVFLNAVKPKQWGLEAFNKDKQHWRSCIFQLNDVNEVQGGRCLKEEWVLEWLALMNKKELWILAMQETNWYDRIKGPQAVLSLQQTRWVEEALAEGMKEAWQSDRKMVSALLRRTSKLPLGWVGYCQASTTPQETRDLWDQIEPLTVHPMIYLSHASNPDYLEDVVFPWIERRSGQLAWSDFSQDQQWSLYRRWRPEYVKGLSPEQALVHAHHLKIFEPQWVKGWAQMYVAENAGRGMPIWLSRARHWVQKNEALREPFEQCLKTLWEELRAEFKAQALGLVDQPVVASYWAKEWGWGASEIQTIRQALEDTTDTMMQLAWVLNQALQDPKEELKLGWNPSVWSKHLATSCQLKKLDDVQERWVQMLLWDTCLRAEKSLKATALLSLWAEKSPKKWTVFAIDGQKKVDKGLWGQDAITGWQGVKLKKPLYLSGPAGEGRSTLCMDLSHKEKETLAEALTKKGLLEDWLDVEVSGQYSSSLRTFEGMVKGGFTERAWEKKLLESRQQALSRAFEKENPESSTAPSPPKLRL